MMILGVVRKNGNLELYDVDTKDTGNYSCIVNYIDPQNEEPVKNIYKHNVQGNLKNKNLDQLSIKLKNSKF